MKLVDNFYISKSGGYISSSEFIVNLNIEDGKISCTFRIDISGRFEYMDDGIYIDDKYLEERRKYLLGEVTRRDKDVSFFVKNDKKLKAMRLNVDDIKNYNYIFYINESTIWNDKFSNSLNNFWGKIAYKELIIKRLLE